MKNVRIVREFHTPERDMLISRHTRYSRATILVNSEETSEVAACLTLQIEYGSNEIGFADVVRQFAKVVAQ